MHPLIEDYSSQRPRYISLERAFIPLLERAAHKVQVQVFRLEARVKEIASLEEKINREGKIGKYAKLSDVTDLCGLRVVLFDTDSCAAFIEVVRQHFEVDETNSTDKSIELDEDQFGYRSTHLVISLSEHRRGLLEYEELIGLKAELQVRTVLQHAWSVLDHKLRYKSELEAPKELRRKLFRISAMLEAADEAFLEIGKASEILQRGYYSKVSAGEMDIEINKDSLSAFINGSDVFRMLLTRYEAVGSRLHIDLEAGPGPWNYLINSLLEVGIDTLEKLKSRISRISNREIVLLHEIERDGPISAYGVYTFLRDAVLSTLPCEDVRRVLQRFPTNSSLASVEEAAFERWHQTGLHVA